MATSPATSKLYVALIVLMGIIVGYLFYSSYIVPTQTAIPAPPISNSDNLATFQNLKIDFSVLDNPAYKNLMTYGESPVNPGATGKKDLFAPQ